MNRSIKYYILIIIISLSGTYSFLVGQNTEIKNVGISFITNYSPKENNFNRQTWDISKSPNGLVYFANGSLLGAGNRYWKTFDLKNGNSIKCVYAINNDSILVGGTNDIGIFTKGKNYGTLEYHSMMSNLDSSYHKFGTAWHIMEYQQKIFIRTGSAILEYSPDTIVPILHSELFEFMTIFDDTMYTSILGKGLGKYTGTQFKLLPYGAAFAKIKILGFFKLNPEEKIIFTDDDGAFLEKNGMIYPYKQDLFQQMAIDQISAVKMIDNQYFAIGTVKNGVYIIDREGNLIQHINKNAGLQNNTVISMTIDESNNLWLGLDNGISYIELNSCISKINSESDIGTGYVSSYFNKILYLGTNQGLFYTIWDPEKTKPNRNIKIESVKNISGQVWSLFKSKDKLYCGHHKGLYLIDGNQAILVDQNKGCWQLDSIRHHPGFFLESTYRGFFVLKAGDNNSITSLGKLGGLKSNGRTFIQDEAGRFWTVSSDNRIIRFSVDPETSQATNVEEFNQKKGLPNFKQVKMVGSEKQVFFSTEYGLYKYNEENDIFVNEDFYNQVIGTNHICYEFFEDNFDRIWYVIEGEIGYFSLHFGQPEKISLPFSRLSDSYTRIFGEIGVIDRDNILFGVDEGFYHYTSSCNIDQLEKYNSFITDFEPVSTLVKWNKDKVSKTQIPVFGHRKNAFTFSFTSNIFVDHDNVLYKYKLEGQDDEWSEWTQRNIKEYSNLWEGRYIFRVVAVNKYGIESSESSMSFVVEPPIYRSVYAYFLYSFLIILTFIAIRIVRLRKFELERNKIEQKKQEELEQKRLNYEREQLKDKQKIISLQNEKLEQDLLYKTKELSNSTYTLLQKNELLQKLQIEMKALYHEKNVQNRDKVIKRLMRQIGNEINTKKDWEVFDLHFSAVHEDFINKLHEKYPELNQNDQRICIFLKMNKSTKEIATLMNMSIRGVETSRYRIRKKMGLSRDDNLFDEISGI